MTAHVLIFVFLYLLLGSFTGLFSGMLGIGGGLVVVPGLVWIFHYGYFPQDSIMHFAVGTSLAAMIITTARALLAHRHYHVEYLSIFKKLVPGIIIGVVIGVVLGRHLHSRALEVILGVSVLVIALDMLFAKSIDPRRQLPGTLGLSFFGMMIAAISGLLGLGGGTFMIPFLTYCNVSIRQAMIISIATGCTVAVIGTLSFMMTGLLAHKVSLPWSTGYVYWPALIGIVVGSLSFVPLGVALSYRIPANVLRRVFAVFLCFVGLRLLIP